jgi:hypothetical protein
VSARSADVVPPRADAPVNLRRDDDVFAGDVEVFSDCPRIFSLSPSVYTSAVSKKLIPASIDVLMRASASVCPWAPTNLKIPRPSPKVMVPKQSLETRRPACE